LALGKAAINGHAEIVRMLLLAGAQPAWRDVGGTTPIHVAIERYVCTVLDNALAF
jgi:ankyrin repeat protein